MRRISGGRTRRIEDEEEEAIGGWRIRGRGDCRSRDD